MAVAIIWLGGVPVENGRLLLHSGKRRVERQSQDSMTSVWMCLGSAASASRRKPQPLVDTKLSLSAVTADSTPAAPRR